MDNLHIVSLKYLSLKPKKGWVRCTVPGCKRQWWLEHSSQGFMLASAESHAYAHWRRHHVEHKHQSKFLLNCSECIKDEKPTP